MNAAPPSLPETVTEIAALLAAGDIGRAQDTAEAALQRGKESADLFQLAGVCAVRLGQAGPAESHWRRALALNPGHAGAAANLAVLLQEQGRSSEAMLQCAAALMLDDANAELQARYGTLLAQQRRYAEAEAAYRRALALQPADALTLANLGVLLAQLKRDLEAEDCYRQSLALQADNPTTLTNLGVLLARQSRLQEAQQCHMRALDLAPGHAAAYTNLGLLLEQDGQGALAEQCHRKALALQPNAADILGNLGNLLAKQHRYEEAEHLQRDAIAAQPEAPSAYSNLAVLLADTGRDGEAEQLLRRALALDPRYPVAAYNLATLLFQQGDYAQAWPYYEARHDPFLSKKIAPPPAALGTRWQGQALHGGSILVWPEQGLGDLIQFSRYIPLLKRHGAGKVTLVCHDELQAALRTLDGVDICVPLSGAATLAPHDYCTLALSLPYHLRTEEPAIPSQLPYLRVLPDRAAQWKEKLPAPGGEAARCKRIGLVWRGNPLHANDSERSLPSLATLAPLWALADLQFVSLQLDQAGDEAAAGQPLLALGSQLRDFGDTAAVLSMLDLLISVDTSAAHLAGALGVPCWLLLPAYKTDWRWMRTRSDTPWYPKLMRLFRQPQRGDWATPVAQVVEALRRLQACEHA